MIHNHFTSVASFTFPDFTWWMYSRFAEAELGVDLRKLLVLLPMWVSFVTGALCGANLKAIPSQCYLYFSNLLTALGPALAFLALFNQIYEYLRYLSKTLKLGMLFLEGIRTDRTVRRKTCLKNWRSSERHLFEVPLLNVFWASMLCSFQLSPPHSLDWYTWLWGSVFFVAARLDVSLDVFITSTTSWPVHLHAWNFPIFFFQKMWSCKLATHCNTQHFLLLLHVAAWKRAQHE